ncbi:MAG: YigZ family protein [Defluviitaleaceae bacterium]|nr:YigZ family protein [Defluviitaleaceae bacterium]
MLKKHKTFHSYGEIEIIQKKSKFIGHAFYASTEEEVQEILQALRKKHNGANHNCYAFRIEGQSIIERHSDDGEPDRTAGMPILDILRGLEIVNGLIVVTRYFGGTLLGTGGLVKAYSQAAKDAAAAAGVIEKEIYMSVSILCDYTLSGKIEHELKKSVTPIDEIIYTDRVEFRVFALLDEVDRFSERMIDLTNANIQLIRSELIYGSITKGKFVRF